MKGSLVLIGGDPGIGKSTLLLQICGFMGGEHTILYVSGEESETEDKFQTVTYQYNDGIKDYVDYLVKSRKATPVEPDVIDFEAEDLKIGISAEIAMQWTTAYSEAVHTFANTISTTEGGTHEEGFRAALTSLVNRYAREKNRPRPSSAIPRRRPSCSAS